MSKIIEFIDGKKTYFVAGGMIAYALLGYLLKYMDFQQVADVFWAALALFGIRSAMKKME